MNHQIHRFAGARYNLLSFLGSDRGQTPALGQYLKYLVESRRGEVGFVLDQAFLEGKTARVEQIGKMHSTSSSVHWHDGSVYSK
jgi:hypothetical protein